MEKPRKVPIIYKKLGQNQAKGLWFPQGKIYIDSRLEGKEKLTILIHELLHESCQYMDENEVVRVSEYLGEMLSREGY